MNVSSSFDDLLQAGRQGMRTVQDATAGFDVAGWTPVRAEVADAAMDAQLAATRAAKLKRDLPIVLHELMTWNRGWATRPLALLRVEVSQRHAITGGARMATLEVPLWARSTGAGPHARLAPMPDGPALARLAWEQVAEMSDPAVWRRTLQRAAADLPAPEVDHDATGLYATTVRATIPRLPGAGDMIDVAAVRRDGLELRAHVVELWGERPIPPGNWGIGDGTIANRGLWRHDADGPATATLLRGQPMLGNVATATGASTDLPATGLLVLPGRPVPTPG